jgi:hypothetical protein
MADENGKNQESRMVHSSVFCRRRFTASLQRHFDNPTQLFSSKSATGKSQGAARTEKAAVKADKKVAEKNNGGGGNAVGKVYQELVHHGRGVRFSVKHERHYYISFRCNNTSNLFVAITPIVFDQH